MLTWPCKLLVPQNVAWDIASRTLAAPASVSGLTQVVATDAGIWKATYDQVIIRNREQVLAFRAIATLLEGRIGAIVVPRCHAYQPLPDGFTGGLYDQVPHSDEALHSDNSGYVIDASTSVELTGIINPRDTTATIRINYGGRIEPGQDFSIGQRMYRIRTVTYTSATNATITFRPPAREKTLANDPLEFDEPVCRMRLATDSAMDLDLAMHRFGSPTVTFLEDL